MYYKAMFSKRRKFCLFSLNRSTAHHRYLYTYICFFLLICYGGQKKTQHVYNTLKREASELWTKFKILNHSVLISIAVMDRNAGFQRQGSQKEEEDETDKSVTLVSNLEIKVKV